MPRAAKGVRLYWREDHGKFYIRDTGRPDRSTGTSDRREAEKRLAEYIAGRDIPTGPRYPDRITVSEVLDIYGREHAVTTAAPERIAYAIEALVRFWGELPLSSVKKETCRRYQRSRVKTLKDGTERPVSDGTVRRELGVLQAAINYCMAEGYVINAPGVTLPDRPPARDRWLTREEAARLLWSAWRSPRAKHLARFILIALYTGTRKDAILRLGFMRNTAGGWIDVDSGMIYRRGTEERETAKRRPPLRMPDRLAAHCRRWRKSGDVWAVNFRGQRVADIQTAFEHACDRAGLLDVSPHTLKHTAITWAMMQGMPLDAASQYFGTSRETILRTYWHHHPDYDKQAAQVMNSKHRKLGALAN